MTEHPAIAAGCTPEEIDSFERLTINDQSGHTDAVINSLFDKGLIQVAPDWDRNGKFAVYYTPPHIHHQFCSWAAEQPGGEPL